MHLKRNSKLLQKANENNYAVYLYHNTPVVYWDKVSDDVVIKHNGWETRATASAMNYALEDIGVNARVRYSHDNIYLGDQVLSNEEVFRYTRLLEH